MTSPRYAHPSLDLPRAPLPERPTPDEATDRGWDSESVRHDRVPMDDDPELMAALRDQAHGIRVMRDEDHEWRAS